MKKKNEKKKKKTHTHTTKNKYIKERNYEWKHRESVNFEGIKVFVLF